MAGEGYFPRGESVLRRVHGARIVGLAYGQRALLLQATDPLAFAGLMANTAGRAAPFQRLVHTAKTMEKVFFGTRAEADAETERVRALHARVRGSVGGSSYAADDPQLLLWVLACLADSAQVLYETFVRPLSRVEREAFWRDYLTVGELFGLPRAAAPPAYADFRAYMEERLASDDLHVLPEAREICRTIIDEMPVPSAQGPFVAGLHFLVVGLLPERVRSMYGFGWGGWHQRAFDALAFAHRRALPVVPRPVRRGSSVANYETVAREERRRLRAA